ncbi:protein of unknown function [Petrocella atlantisensis]|uniref:Uncharacterized protein n=1 Tax=Petrocella atlantisensis TaxID=2173034 RepID=A0A3P7S280_9FIRM|nr:protein of unknown function [Petrocella atlantisensis]
MILKHYGNQYCDWALYHERTKKDLIRDLFSSGDRIRTDDPPGMNRML